jgi:hypothetical protein
MVEALSGSKKSNFDLISPMSLLYIVAHRLSYSMIVSVYVMFDIIILLEDDPRFR